MKCSRCGNTKHNIRQCPEVYFPSSSCKAGRPDGWLLGSVGVYGVSVSVSMILPSCWKLLLEGVVVGFN